MSNTCIASSSSSSGGGTACQASPLPSLPPIIRNDKETYLAQRLNLPPLPQNRIQTNDNNDNNSNNSNSQKLPKAWMKKEAKRKKFKNALPFTSDLDYECRLYMAPSRIPNSGLGMFAGIDIPPGTCVDINPQVVLPLLDITTHIGEEKYDNSILTNYPWLSYTQGLQLEANEASVLFPNLGMLANSHLGLVNAKLIGTNRPRYSRIEDRNVNPGTGAYLSTDGLSFSTNHDKGIEEGEEIFVDYGPSYFHHRESKWGILFPTKDDYKKADELARKYQWDGDEDTLDEAQAKWDDLLKGLHEGTVDLDRETDEKDEKKSQQRIAYALPESVKDTKHVAEIGTARYSIPEPTRTMHDLKGNGICLDNLRKGKSNIPQAGFGAFATANIEAESIVVPAPLLPIPSDLLEMTFDNDENGSEEKTVTTQVLHNYCFGDTDSSLLFFPYSSSIHYINHDGINPNAYLRWSDSGMSKSELLEKGVDDVSAGLVMEVVAMRDIAFGEEVTIDYGEEWAVAWYDHVATWKIRDKNDLINPQSFIENYKSSEGNEKKPFRTMDELEENPYPTCIRTACYSQKQKGKWMHTNFQVEFMRFCDITERTYQDGRYWYSAKMSASERDDDDVEKEKKNEGEGLGILELIPHKAVFLLQDKYCTDLHVNGFRHAIGVPEDLYPDQWLDLLEGEEEKTSEKEEESGQEEEETAEEEEKGGESANVSCDTTAGNIRMRFIRAWSPNGYDRAVGLFERGFYDHTHFFRVIPGFLTQFGMR